MTACTRRWLIEALRDAARLAEAQMARDYDDTRNLPRALIALRAALGEQEAN